MKEEVQEIINQIFQFLRKDKQLQKDQQLYLTLFSNRELAVNKLHREAWHVEPGGTIKA
jgi:ArsR family transcriptional regulator